MEDVETINNIGHTKVRGDGTKGVPFCFDFGVFCGIIARK